MPTISKEKYERLIDMSIINSANYDINRKIDLFVEQINEQLDNWGKEASQAFGLSEEAYKNLKLGGF